MSVKVFISYSHKDKKLREELHDHLSNLIWQGVISAWYDGDIIAGTEWENQIYEHLEAAQVILLLISAGFMSSDFCYSREMKRAIVRHEANEACVIPILLRPVDYENAPFERLQMLPSGGKPVSGWRPYDRAFEDIVKGIKKTIRDLEARAKPPQTSQEQIAPTPDIAHKEHEQKESAPAASNIPFRQNLLFTGRDDILTRLHQAFTKSKQVAATHLQVISGMGGIGKTQTALEYAYRYQDDYKYLLWVKADTHELLVSDLTSLANLLDLPLKDEKDQNLTVAVVKRWLQTHDGWLLILDNAVDLTATIDFLPADAQGHFLLTARELASDSKLRGIGLPNLTPDESALFLLRRARLIELDIPLTAVPYADLYKAREISKMLGDLPLALAQAGAYIEKTRCGLVGYIDCYRLRRTKLLQDGSRLTADHPEPVATTWSLSFDKLEPASADLLRLCAFLHPDAIPQEIFTEGAVELGLALQSIGEDIFALDDAIVELLRYSLIRRNQDEKTLTIHRLVQTVLKDGMEVETQHQWAERAVRAVSNVFPQVEFTTWARCRRLLSHARNSEALIKQWNMEFSEATRLLNQAGVYLKELGLYEEATLFLESALKIRRRTLGQKHPDVVLVLSNLAELRYEEGKYAEAEEWYTKALIIDEEIFGREHENVAIDLSNLAQCLWAQDKYEEAEPFYLRALNIYEQTYGREHPDVATNLNNLAGFYFRKYKQAKDYSYKQAEDYYKEAMEINERLRLVHSSVITNLNLALLYSEQGKYEEAEKLCYDALIALVEALESNEQVPRGESPSMANIFNTFAEIYFAQAKYEEAEEYYWQALAIREQLLGPKHPDVKRVLRKLVHCYYAEAKYKDVEWLSKKFPDIKEWISGSENI